MSDKKNISTITLLNIRLDNITSNELLERLKSGVLFTPNIDHFVIAQKDRQFYEAYRRADFVVLDSQVIFLLKLLFRPRFREKIAGADFFPKYCRYHKNDPEIKIFILGGEGEVAVKVQKKINDDAGRAMVVGALSPSMGFVNDPTEIEKAVTLIRESGANVLAVGLGTPKQEKWIDEYRHRLETVRTFMGVGATFDFMVGKQKRAPKWMQRIALEWLFRLLSNPRKFAKRYLLTDIVFIYYFISDVFMWYRDPFRERK